MGKLNALDTDVPFLLCPKCCSRFDVAAMSCYFNAPVTAKLRGPNVDGSVICIGIGNGGSHLGLCTSQLLAISGTRRPLVPPRRVYCCPFYILRCTNYVTMVIV